MGEKVKGKLVIIGGAEDKEKDCVILKEVVKMCGEEKARMVIITTATEKPHEVGREYEYIFGKLGIRDIRILNIQNREHANDDRSVETILDATGVFFTGGDQLRITSLLGGTKVYQALHTALEQGVIIIGTSAGASVMSDNMIVEGYGDDSPKKNTVNMAPGMGLIEEVVIDQHFAQRGRIGRLLGAIAQNPYVLGIGIDEDTAIVVEPQETLKVIGSQTVMIIDGTQITHTNVSELKPKDPLALFNVKIHVLPHAYGFDLKKRKPVLPQQ